MSDEPNSLEPYQDDDTRKWTSLVFDSTILTAFMRCPREMDFRFNKHLVPTSAKSPFYAKGTLIHKGMEVFYGLMKDGHDWSLRNAEALKAMRMMAPTLGLDTEHILDCYRNWEEYSEYRKNDVFTVMFTEYLFRFKAYEVFPLRIYLTGKMDLGVLEGTTTTPYDHKTESESWHYSPLNNQFKIYAMACKSKKLVVNRFGFQKTKKAEDKFKRAELYFEQDALDEFRDEILPYYAKQMVLANYDNFYPPNYASCIQGHFGCIFSDKYNGGVCNLSRELRDQKLAMHFHEKEWNMNEG